MGVWVIGNREWGCSLFRRIPMELMTSDFGPPSPYRRFPIFYRAFTGPEKLRTLAGGKFFITLLAVWCSLK